MSDNKRARERDIGRCGRCGRDINLIPEANIRSPADVSVGRITTSYNTTNIYKSTLHYTKIHVPHDITALYQRERERERAEIRGKTKIVIKSEEKYNN